MRIVVLAAAALGLAGSSAVAAPPPAPDVGRIDYARPTAYLDLPPSLGDVQRVRSIAQQLRQDSAEATLASIGRWVRRNLAPDPKASPAWRPIETILKSGTYSGCGEHAVVFGALARACGVPTVWVKTMDVEWILAFRRREPAARKAYLGRVFLEVHVDGAWRLLDSEAGLLYPQYATSSRLLPGNRYAYDKGADPFELVLPCRHEEWKAQTEGHFESLDLGQIPWSQPRDLMNRWNVYVAGGEPQSDWAAAAAKALRFAVPAVFRDGWDHALPRVRGATLVVLASGGRPVFPPDLVPAWLPPNFAPFLAARGDGQKDWIDRRLEDGTRVVLVRAEDEEGVTRALAEALR